MLISIPSLEAKTVRKILNVVGRPVTLSWTQRYFKRNDNELERTFVEDDPRIDRVMEFFTDKKDVGFSLRKGGTQIIDVKVEWTILKDNIPKNKPLDIDESPLLFQADLTAYGFTISINTDAPGGKELLDKFIEEFKPQHVSITIGEAIDENDD